MQRLALVLTIFSVITAAWLLDRAARPHFCFHSDTISSFTISNIDGDISVPQCRFATLFNLHTPFSPQRLTDWNSKLAHLGSWVRQFGTYKTKVDLLISVDRPLLNEVSNHRIELGTSVADATGQLERAFLQVWFLQNVPGTASMSLLEQELLADLASAVLNNGLELQNPVSSEIASYSDSYWLRWIYSWRGLCRSPWYSASIEPVCRSFQTPKVRAGLDLPASLSEQFSPWSLRALMGYLYWHTYQNLPLLARAEFFPELIQALKSSPHLLTLDWRSRVFDDQGVAHSSKIFDSLEANLLSPSLSEKVKASWKKSASSVLAQLNTVDRPTDLHNISIESEPEVFHKEDLNPLIKAANDNPSWAGVVSIGQRHFILPNRDPVQLVLDGVLPFERWAWQSCSQIHLPRVIRESVTHRRVLLVDRCSQVKPIDYVGYARQNVDSFAHGNPQTAFLEIQPQALRLAARISGVSLEKIQWHWRAQHHRASRIEHLVGLEQPQWDEWGGAFHVTGAIEGIDWFRSPQPYLAPKIN